MPALRNILMNNSISNVVNNPSPWDITRLNYTGNSYAAAYGSGGLAFSANGSKMYSTNWSTVYQFNLSTPWDILTASYANKSLNISSAQSIFFSADGTKLYGCIYNSTSIRQYNLSTAWDVSTGSFFATLSLSNVDASIKPYSIFFNAGGTIMYIYEDHNDYLYRFNLSTAWNITTATYSGTYLALSNAPSVVLMKPDGTRIYTLGYYTRVIYRYNLTSAWDIATASYSGDNKNLTDYANGSAIFGLYFKSDGSKLYLQNSPKIVYEFAM
jgi:hypothetical protein